MAIRVSDISDARLEPYRNLKDRELAAMGGKFLAEGEHLVRRLNASEYAIESVLMSDRRVDEMEPVIRPGVPVYVIDESLMREVIGYKFHSGIIACGLRGSPKGIDDVMGELKGDQITLVVCPEIANAENMGSIIRLCAGFGVDAIVLGERCTDPWFRQTVRVSMGTIFKMPIAQCTDLVRDLTRLREKWGVELIATVLDATAENLKAVARKNRTALLLGNEAQGLSAAEIAACDRKVTIPMKKGTDSLNVAVAAGIFLYHFTL